MRSAAEWQTRYAKSGDLSIAYQVAGEGAVNLVFVPGMLSHLELFHELPGYTRFLQRFASFSRLAVFDKRGQGLSDRPDHAATLEERIDDIRAVMDASGMEQAVIVGFSEGVAATILFAATYPARVQSLVLCGGFARFGGDPGEGAVAPPELAVRIVDSYCDGWGEGIFFGVIAPTMAGADRELATKAERFVSSPRAARELFDVILGVDVRPVLPSIQVPTLVVRRDDEAIPKGASTYLAEQIPDARYVEVPGVDHVPWIGDGDAYVEVIEEFLTGQRHQAVEEPDRVLATILFCDIVGSTQRVATLGDARWRSLLDEFQARVRGEIVRHRGREVNTRGDDFLMTFDGPARAVRCARAVAGTARAIGLQVRAGVHTGEVELRGDDVAGLTVHIGARVAAMAQPNEVLTTATVRDLVVGSGLAFEDRGEHELRGVPGAWRVVAVQGSAA